MPALEREPVGWVASEAPVPYSKSSLSRRYVRPGEEAARFYTSVLPNSQILEVARYGTAGPRPEGTVMTVSFELDGRKFVALCRIAASGPTLPPRAWERSSERPRAYSVDASAGGV